MSMIRFDSGDSRFNFRTVGILLTDGRVLLHRWEGDPFWALPGGRVELQEPAADALRREMAEELGVAVEIERLVWIVENFFEYDRRAYHELAFYFLMSVPPESELLARGERFEGFDAGVRLLFQWFDVGALEPLELYPTFLKQSLSAIPAVPVHIVHRDS